MISRRFEFFKKQLFKSKGAVIGLGLIIFFISLSILAPIIAPHDPTQIYSEYLRLAPFENMSFILGTDDVGRDTFSRLIYGSRISIITGFMVVIFSASIGTFLGLMAGYFEGKVDLVISKFIDMLMALPSILLAITVVSILGPGYFNAIIAISIVAIPTFTRIVRASVMQEKQKEYVTASVSFGAGHFRTIFKEVLPNCMAPLMVQATLGFSDGILNTAALGFLGLGAQAPLSEWGVMLADGRPFIESSPWLVTLPGLCILFVVLGFNLLGDGVRDALDPKTKD